MDYVDELKRIPELAAVGEALVNLAGSLVPGTNFVRAKGGLWISAPHNFVAFRVQAARAKNISFTVYGMKRKFEEYAVLPLEWTRSSYRTFKVDSPRQLGPAASYIASAALAHALRRRKKELIEQVERVLLPIGKEQFSRR